MIENGVGGLNIDECRIATNDTWHRKEGVTNAAEGYLRKNKSMYAEKSEGQMNKNGRFPANVILSYDQMTIEEVCGAMPYTKGNGNIRHNKNIHRNCYGKYNPNEGYGYSDEGSASRYFKNCQYTRKDDDLWKSLYVNNAEENLKIIQAIKDNIAQMNVEDLLNELKSHYAKYVENQLDLLETPIVQDIAKILIWDFKIETSQVIQDFIINSKKCIQFQNLVQFVENLDNIDTTQITQNLLKLFGYVKTVIINYIQGNLKYEQRRYIYEPKASKKDRDEGLHIKNTHATVKPTSLMQYLIRLVSPKGATILDPFMGSGSTGKAVMYENKERNADYKFIGIEKEKEYYNIAEARIQYVLKNNNK